MSSNVLTGVLQGSKNQRQTMQSVRSASYNGCFTNCLYLFLYCSAIYRPPPFTIPPCPDSCRTTFCKACYYSNTPRPAPSKCDNLCKFPPTLECLNDWACCVGEQVSSYKTVCNLSYACICNCVDAKKPAQHRGIPMLWIPMPTERLIQIKLLQYFVMQCKHK